MGRRTNSLIPSGPRPIVGCLLGVCALLPIAAGCTQVTVHSGDGTVSERLRFGAISLALIPRTTPQIVDLRGFGLHAQNGRVTLGYVASSTAALPATDCRLVLWIDDGAAALAEIAALLDGTPDLCAVGPGTAPLSTAEPARPN